MPIGNVYSALKIWHKGQHVHIKKSGIFADIILIMNQNLEKRY